MGLSPLEDGLAFGNSDVITASECSLNALAHGHELTGEGGLLLGALLNDEAPYVARRWRPARDDRHGVRIKLHSSGHPALYGWRMALPE